MTIELRHLEYFRAVAEELNFGRAAERLFISQPGLSRQIKQMEEILEVQLFERTKRKVELTAAGQFLKAEVDYIFNHLELTKTQIKEIAAGNIGELRVGFLGSAAHTVIPELLVKISQTFPRIQTSLEELSNAMQIEMLEKDKLDLGFVRLARVPESLEMKMVHQDTFSVVLPLGHPLTEEGFKHVGQLKDENFILFSQDYSSIYYDKIMSICEDRGFSPRITHKSVHALTIFKLVEAGLGVAIVPTSLKQGYDLKVKFIEMDKIKQKTELYAVWKKGNRNAALGKVLRLIINS
ncbi:als operon regulatory protein AlsR, putative [Indibacter alkaliphilus LW1]|uniref:Als operon regulatory protein AlsR, putative n=1 Tax=Indibacter alkaliphilus (strain CCUG 57479 / KCTC 22604 / LW1) TaxID=1189612 RepID=S2DJP9_INDAL|nr:LysR family transcriptional regulator [Indibacter alkaliphilus]EOZ99314.1 als operon regulatory protein AlsR, putative [Indibacter alkaliphilus LW1]